MAPKRLQTTSIKYLIYFIYCDIIYIGGDCMCTKTELNSILAEFFKLSKIHFGDELKETILFGSYARGDFDEESDIDIALIMEVPHENENKFNKQIVEIMSNLYEEYGYNTVLSPIVISREFFEKWKNDLPFYRNVNTEGVRIVA